MDFPERLIGSIRLQREDIVYSGRSLPAAIEILMNREGRTMVTSSPEMHIAIPKEQFVSVSWHSELKTRIYHFLKRLVDIAVAVIGLALMGLPMLVIALLIKLESPGPVFYVHHRIGKDGRDLPLYKFRSMVTNAEELFEAFTPEQKAEWEANFKLEHDPRITRIGKFLRRSSLDELPQLVNVLKGQLSIVGPRPVVREELEKYGEYRFLFLSVMPGLTGYWQAYARSTCSYEQRMEMELHYAGNANFWWDIRIMLKTVSTVLLGRGAA